MAAYHHWGPDSVRRLRGMFSFVIRDRRERVVFGARDPFGIKPLFHLVTEHGVYFASEKKALLPFCAWGDSTINHASHPVAVTAQMMMEALPLIVWHLDEPVADPALVPLYYVARKVSEHVTVALSGEGSDEFFAGYRVYREPLSLRAVTGLPATMRRGLRAVSKAIPQGVKGRSFLERGTTSLEERYYGNARMYTEREKSSLLRQYDPTVRYTDVTAPIYAEATGLGDVEKMQRRAMAGIVPPDIVNRVKLGFPTPIRVWLRGEMYDSAGPSRSC